MNLFKGQRILCIGIIFQAGGKDLTNILFGSDKSLFSDSDAYQSFIQQFQDFVQIQGNKTSILIIIVTLYYLFSYPSFIPFLFRPDR